MELEIRAIKNQLEYKARIMANDVQRYKKNRSLDDIDNHSLPEHILLGLILNTAIVLGEYELASWLIFLIESSEFSSDEMVDAITCVDHSGYSVMSTVLYSGNQTLYDEMIDLISGLDKDIIKVKCCDRDAPHFNTIIRCPQFDIFEAKDCIEVYIRPIFDIEFIQDIIEMVN